MGRISKLIGVLFVAASLLVSGCGRNVTTDKDDKEAVKISEKQDKENKDKGEPEKTNNDNNEPVKKVEPKTSKGGIYKEPGMELSDFYDAYNGALSRFEQPVNRFETSDFELFDIGFDMLAATINVVNIVQFDYLQPGDNAKETGKNGKFDAVREKNGNIIAFRESMTREEDGFGDDNLKGDVVERYGFLNTETNTLVLEGTTKRNGQIISRFVNEVVILPDGTILAQIFDKPKKPTDERISDKGNAYFVYCTEDKLEIIKASFEPDVNFKFETIVGKSNVTLETMSEGYKKVRKLTVENDVATAMKY
ncbi:MAG: hypothetical protein GX022_08650 [Clostridiaceae bacterium]|nr:hypothetical protein [Clostridiaceae bacterium]